MIKTLIVSAVILALGCIATGCTSQTNWGAGDEGYLMLSADQLGLQELGRTIAGIQEHSKASEGTRTVYMELQEQETAFKGMRFGNKARRAK